MSTRKKGRHPARLGYLGVFAVFLGLYLSQSWPWSLAEVAAAVIGSTLVTALLFGISENVHTRYALRASWFGTLGSLLLTRTPKDCFLVLSSLARERSGEACAVPFDKEAFTHQALDAGHRAMAITGVSVGPNTVVIDVDPTHDRLIVHQLVHTSEPPGAGNRLWPIAP